VPTSENGQTFDVEISADLDPATGLLTVVFQSIDPNTNLPPTNPLTGFLPPDNGFGSGDGFVSYIVDSNSNLPTGTAITNVAQIVFDGAPPIATDQVNDDDPTQGVDPNKQALVTIDAGPPTSSVSPLAATTTSTDFTVSWSGTDDAGGSGIASYDVYVSDDNGPFTLWQSDTTQTSATYTGQYGHTYGFYSVATDNVGNVQPPPTAAQAVTLIAGIESATGSTVVATEGVAASLAVATFTDADPTADASQFSAEIVWGDGSTTAGAVAADGDGSFTVTGSHAYAEEGGYTFTATITDASGESVTAAGTAQVSDAPPSVVANQAAATFVYGTIATDSGTFSDYDDAVTIAASEGTVTQIGSTDGTWNWSESGLSVGTYQVTITATNADGSASTSSFVVTVTPAMLTITADDKRMIYSGSMPVLTASYAGLVNGDSLASLTSPPVLATVPADSHAGTYPI
ncbi:MAG: MBG domain-containing protein, partial [Pirellulales bacterium]